MPVLVGNDKFNFFDASYYSDAAIDFKGNDNIKTIRDLMKVLLFFPFFSLFIYLFCFCYVDIIKELFKLQVVEVMAGDRDSIRKAVEKIRKVQ